MYIMKETYANDPSLLTGKTVKVEPEDLPPNQALAIYLMASYGYYILDIPVISDTEYDNLAKHLLNVYDKITHVHRHLVDKNSLEAGTLFSLKEKDYPTIVKTAFHQFSEVQIRSRH